MTKLSPDKKASGSGETAPMGYLASAAKRMPWLKYAEAALAIAAIGAIVQTKFHVDPFQAFLWALPFLCLMFVLVEFKRHAEGRTSLVVRFLIWCFAGIAVVTVGLLIGCHFWPRLCQPTPSISAKPTTTEIDGPALVECLTNGNVDNITCPIYQGRFSSPTTVEIAGTVDEIRAACDPEWRDASLYLYCNDQESDHKDFLIPRERGKGVPNWQPPREGDGTNFSFKCSARLLQATSFKLTVHPRGCSNVRLTNTKIRSTTE